MKFIQLFIFLIFCLNIYSAHAGITGTPTPKSAQTAANTDDNHDHEDSDEENEEQPKNVTFKLALSLVFLVLAAWLITFGANQILDQFNLGQLFIGYTVLAIGTSLPEIAASVSLALKGRYETVSGTLIGSNIFNGLCVLAIPGLFSNPEMNAGWNYASWSPLLLVLFIVTFLFASFIFYISKKERKASFFISIFFLSSYFISLYFAY